MLSHHSLLASRFLWESRGGQLGFGLGSACTSLDKSSLLHFPSSQPEAWRGRSPEPTDPNSDALRFRLLAWHWDSGLPRVHPQPSLQATEDQRQLSQPVDDLRLLQPPLSRPQAEQIFSIPTAEFIHSRELRFLSPELIGSVGAQAHLCLGPALCHREG